MAHFAHIENDIVDQVIVIDQETLDTGNWGDPKEWKQCSYNTHGGEHSQGGVPLRKNYPGVGWTYDKKRDAFIPPQPHKDWTLNEDTCMWESPTQ